MSLSAKFVAIAKKVLPSPFTIAIFLTFATALLALFLTEPNDSGNAHLLQIAGFWEKGFWELLKFTMQMMMILVLGHALALSKPFSKLIDKILVLCKDMPSAAFVVTFFTLIFAFINWGLGLVFGAIFARKLGEYAKRKNIPLNYPLIGAAAYSGLMVWHGGLSGSAPLTITGEKHFLVEKIGVIPVQETIFSTMNITTSLLLLIILPSLMYFIAKRSETAAYSMPKTEWDDEDIEVVDGAEKLDHSKIFAFIIGGIFLAISIWKAIEVGNFFKMLNLNAINFLFFGLCLLFHGSISNFSKAVKTAITGSTGILIQFPLYAGIMGIMKYSGLINEFSAFFVQISNDFTFPFFTFISAGIVNVFVPSGGGQWAVQGPIIVEAASQLNVSLPKCVMALSYGDQLTNMLQPFWALPLLGITGLKAKEILPYTFLMFLAGLCVFGLILAIF